MREIKFRAWGKIEKRIIPSSEFARDFNLSYLFLNTNSDMANRLNIMQYTGLKDKNGKEIYEGDIVKWGHISGSIENPIRIAEVQINPDIQFVTIKNKYIYRYGQFFYKCNEALEVIGNIYENTELLEAKNA